MYSIDVIDECSITLRLCQALVLEAKENNYYTMLCRYFWLSDKNKINQNKSSSTSLPTINHHQPTSSSWSSLWSWSLQTLLFTDVDECSDKIHVCDVNAKCTNTNGSHNCTCTDGYIGDGKSCQGALITILITTWVTENMFNNELNDCQTKLPLIHHFRYRWMQQWKPCECKLY